MAEEKRVLVKVGDSRADVKFKPPPDVKVEAETFTGEKL